MASFYLVFLEFGMGGVLWRPVRCLCGHSLQAAAFHANGEKCFTDNSLEFMKKILKTSGNISIFTKIW